MIVNCSGKEAEKQALSVVQKNVKKQVLKSKTVSKSGIELTLEVWLKGDDCDFVNEISETEGVESAVLVAITEITCHELRQVFHLRKRRKSRI